MLLTQKSTTGSGANHPAACSSEQTEAVPEGINAQSIPSTMQLKCAQTSSSRARKLPTKKMREGDGAKSPAAFATEFVESSLRGGNNNIFLTHSKQPPIVHGWVGTATSLIDNRQSKKTASKKMGLMTLDPQNNDEHIIQKREKAKTAKSVDMDTHGGGVKSSSASREEQSKLFSNETDIEDMQIKNAVNDVICTVADELHHCAFLFELTNRPIISSEMEGGSNKKIFVAPNTTHCSSKISDGETSLAAMKHCATSHSLGLPQGFSAETSKAPPTPQVGSDSYQCGINNIIEAVRRFVMEVYCPFLLSAGQSMKKKSPNVDRIC